jgi:hypothetical protein
MFASTAPRGDAGHGARDPRDVEIYNSRACRLGRTVSGVDFVHGQMLQILRLNNLETAIDVCCCRMRVRAKDGEAFGPSKRSHMSRASIVPDYVCCMPAQAGKLEKVQRPAVVQEHVCRDASA